MTSSRRAVTGWSCMGLALALIFTTFACDSGSRGSGIAGPLEVERHATEDSTVVRTLSGSVWGDTMVLVPRMALGELDGPTPFVFGAPWSVDIDHRGRLYVVDRQAREVRVFEPDGRHRLSFGREGQGPGEFRAPDDVHVTGHGEILVRDQVGARVSLFSEEGEFLRSFPLRGGFSTGQPSYLDRRGHLFVPLIRGFNPERNEWVWVVYAIESGQAVDTVVVPLTHPNPPEVAAFGPRGSGNSMIHPVPFHPSEFWALSPEGEPLLAVADRLRWTRFGAEGRVQVVERDEVPAPVDPAEGQAEVDRITRNFRQLDPAWRWPAGRAPPAHKPYFREMVAGSDGSVWLQRHVRGEEVENPAWNPDDPDAAPRTLWQEPVVMDVFDRDGLYMGPVRLPDDWVPWRRGRFSLERVILITGHPLGHEQVVVFDLMPGGGGSLARHP